MAITFSLMADTPGELMEFLSTLSAGGFTGKMAVAPQGHIPCSKATDYALDVPVAAEPKPEEPVKGYRSNEFAGAAEVAEEPDTYDGAEQYDRQKRKRRTKAEMQAAREAESRAERHPLADVCDTAEAQADADLARAAHPQQPAAHAHTHGTHTPAGKEHKPSEAWTKESITALIRKAQKSIPTDQVVGHIRACGYGSISAMPAEKYQELADRINEKLGEIEALNRKF